MKNTQKHFGIFALVAIIGLLLAGCGEADSGATFTVTYSGNGNTGGTAPEDSNSPYAKNATVTVLGNTGNLVKDGHTFDGWNTAANGSGTSYAVGATFSITANTTLHAQWTSPFVPGADLAEKLQWLKDNVRAGREYTVRVTKDEIQAPYTFDYPDQNTNVKITLIGTDSMREIALSTNGILFEIASGITLTLDENITLKGRGGNNDTSLILVNQGGTLIMNNNVVITQNGGAYNWCYGGAVQVRGTFTMNNGTISNCTGNYGGGVNVRYAGSVFTMNGGTIENCLSAGGGGIHVDNGATFNFNGGEIKNNTTDNSGGGGGVITYGTMNMAGGTINGNNADGPGGGVFIYTDGTLTMTSGTISGNSATWGGGIFTRAGTLEKTGGIVYGAGEEENSNTARWTGTYTGGNPYGHAAGEHQYDKYRNSTHGPSDTRLYAQGSFLEGWDN